MGSREWSPDLQRLLFDNKALACDTWTMQSRFFGSVHEAGSNTTASVARNRGRYEEDAYSVPLNEITKALNEQSKLITDSMQQNTSLAKLCEEMKNDVAQLRREVSDIKENFTTLNSKVDGKLDGKLHHSKKNRKKLPTDLTVRPIIFQHSVFTLFNQ